MVKKKQKSKKQTVLFSLIIVVLLSISIIGYMILNKNRYIYNLGPKEQLQKELQTALDAQKIPGELVYSKLTDRGCEKNGVGLAQSYDCNFLLQKYYKNDRKTTSIDKVSPAGPNITSFISNRKGLKSRFIQTDYTVFPPGLQTFDLANRTRIPEKLINLSADEYLAGWQYKITYWYCSEETTLQLPCPTPPSPVK